MLLLQFVAAELDQFLEADRGCVGQTIPTSGTKASVFLKSCLVLNCMNCNGVSKRAWSGDVMPKRPQPRQAWVSSRCATAGARGRAPVYNPASHPGYLFGRPLAGSLPMQKSPALCGTRMQ